MSNSLSTRMVLLAVCIFGVNLSSHAQQISFSPNPAIAGQPVTISTTACGGPHVSQYKVDFFESTSSSAVYQDISQSNYNANNGVSTAVGQPFKTIWTPPAAGTYYAGASAYAPGFCASSWGPTAITVNPGAPPPPSYPGFINPKYVVMGVTYAPPGPSSYVSYSTTVSVGNTSNVASSFANDVGYSVSVKNTLAKGEVAGVGGVVQVTGTTSTDYTSQSNSSQTVTITKSTAIAYKTNGTGNAYSPVNHDYDTIWLWLNPIMDFTYTPASSSNGQDTMQFNGYSYDPNDPSGSNGPDVVGIQVGYLNGDFGTSQAVNTILARGWVSGQTFPAGDSAALNATDIANIVGNDPLLNASYTELSSHPSTTADGRFTEIGFPPNPVTYLQAGPGNGGGTTTTYSPMQVNSQSVAQGATYTYKVSIGLEENFGGSFFGIGVTEDFKQTNTMTWTESWLNTLNTTTTLSNSVQIVGPPCPATTAPCVPSYAGPGQFLIYQDNLYGTFLFLPGN